MPTLSKSHVSEWSMDTEMLVDDVTANAQQERKRWKEMVVPTTTPTSPSAFHATMPVQDNGLAAHYCFDDNSNLGVVNVARSFDYVEKYHLIKATPTQADAMIENGEYLLG